MATVSIPKLGLVRTNVPLEEIRVLQTGMMRITFRDDQTYADPSMGETGALLGRIVMCSPDQVFVSCGVDEFEDQANKNRSNQAQLVIPQVMGPGNMPPR